MSTCTLPHAPPNNKTKYKKKSPKKTKRQKKTSKKKPKTKKEKTKQNKNHQKPNKPTRKSKCSFMLFVVETYFNVFTLQSSKKIH